MKPEWSTPRSITMTNVTATELQEETGLYEMKSLDKMKMLEVIGKL
jgi:hypothetical protein